LIPQLHLFLAPMLLLVKHVKTQNVNHVIKI